MKRHGLQHWQSVLIITFKLYKPWLTICDVIICKANHKYFYTADIDFNFITDECPTISVTDPQSFVTAPSVTQRESAVATSIDAVVASVASVIVFILLMTVGILLVIINWFRKCHVKEDTITRWNNNIICTPARPCRNSVNYIVVRVYYVSDWVSTLLTDLSSHETCMVEPGW